MKKKVSREDKRREGLACISVLTDWKGFTTRQNLGPVNFNKHAAFARLSTRSQDISLLTSRTDTPFTCGLGASESTKKQV